jgi:hypothetical protein
LGQGRRYCQGDRFHIVERRNPAHIPDGAGSGGYEEVHHNPSEIDFAVAYGMPCDAWFVIPVGRAEDGEAVLA